jgi:hypothetical protein
MQRLPATLRTLLLAALFAAAGCGDDGKTALVSGTVEIDGEPLESGTMTFVPIDGHTPTAGGTIKHGRYAVRVPITTMKVSISAPRVVSMKRLYDTPNSPERPITEEALPARFNEATELTIEVKPGSNVRDFPLTSQ